MTVNNVGVLQLFVCWSLQHTLDILNRLVCSLRAGRFHPYFNILLESVFLTAFYGFMCSTGSCVLRVHAFYGFRRSRVYAFLGLCANAYTSPTQTFSPTRGLTFADVTLSARHFSSKSDSLGAAVTIIISRINNSLSLRFHVPLSQASATHVPESPVYLQPAND